MGPRPVGPDLRYVVNFLYEVDITLRICLLSFYGLKAPVLHDHTK